MKMKHLPVPFLLLMTSAACAQDMPLHEILKPGETWQPATTDMPKRPAGTYLIDSLKDPSIKKTACAATTLGDSTLLVAYAADRYIWAYQIQEGGVLGPGDRYCRLRVKGDERRKSSTPPDAYKADPSAMTVDGANRTHVATNLGIQVFDPTGRLCGVFTAPPGRVTDLAFDGDRLFARVGDKTYVRQMLPVAAK